MLLQLISTTSIWVWGSLFLAASVLVVIIVLTFIHKFIRPSHLCVARNDMAVGLLQVIATAYAVLIALLALNVLNSYNQAQNITQLEASYIGNLYRLSVSLPDIQAKEVQANLNSYLAQVITVEWPAHQRGDNNLANKHKGWGLLDHIELTLFTLKPTSFAQQATLHEMLRQINSLYEQRRARILIGQQSIPNVMWGIILIGELLLVIFCGFLGHEDFKMKLFLTSLATASLGLVIILIFALSHPFQGSIGITPDEFTIVQQGTQHFLKFNAGKLQ